MEVDWADGPVAGESDRYILAKLRGQELPMVVPEVPLAVVLPVSMILALGGFVLTRHRPNLRVGA